MSNPEPPSASPSPDTIVLEPFQAPSLREEPADRPPPGDCTHFTCSANPEHRWTPKLGIADCNCAAHQPVVAARFSNCPICNEPPAALRVRVDVTTMAIGVAQRCRGQSSAAVTGYLDLPIRPAGTPARNVGGDVWVGDVMPPGANGTLVSEDAWQRMCDEKETQR